MELLAQAIIANSWVLDENQVERFINLLIKSKNVFIVGAGRSGYVGRAFAMRLMHLGFTVYVVGETTTPAIKRRDTLVAISGSGETESIVHIAKGAKKQGAKIGVITSHLKSTISRLSNVKVQIGGRETAQLERDYLVRQIRGSHEPLAPLGTLFELSAMVFLDTIINELMYRKGKTEAELKKRHSNLE
ncbi:6-phospho-3-hexuloisomerase [Candidatus Micrarchaeota archaeon]|nr:6-phospho-3-hexuloisomerase [Candidatus Micrarchaeota archaeon]